MPSFTGLAEHIYAEVLLRYADTRSLITLGKTSRFFKEYVNAIGLWSELLMQLDPMACPRSCKTLEELKSSAIDLDVDLASLRVKDTTIMNAEVAVENYWGAQSAHCLVLSDRLGLLLLLAGGYYGESSGGLENLPLRCAAVVDTATTPVTLTPCHFEAPPALNMHGAACDIITDDTTSTVRAEVYSFGGGNHVAADADLTRLTIQYTHGVTLDDRPSLSGEVVEPLDESPRPLARSGAQGVLWKGTFILHAGRGVDNVFLDDLWQFDLVTRTWREIDVSGPSPPSRLWHSSQRVGSQWIVFGGSEWRFSPDEVNMDDSGKIWILDLPTLTWTSVSDASGVGPPLLLGNAVVALSSREVLTFGGCKTYNYDRMSRSYGSLYEDICAPWRFDLAKKKWAKIGCKMTLHEEVGQPVLETRYRSHCGAAYLKSQRKIYVFGGARYFLGEYFHDLTAFDLDESAIPPERPKVHLNMLQGVRWTRQFRLTPGVIGRARCLARDGLIAREVLNSLIYTDGDQNEEMAVDDDDSPGFESD
ncbi:hypothetical protein FOZ60_017322 [Perkinsus olseni]|uniref:Uncharacterized protein n=1 Tax=Perkinsus olseni TaxID=32597 RepID=A0A7J6P535_PEROL|nr:hypothetical protein FOZ60_017322 [Perkinsus olseni]